MVPGKAEWQQVFPLAAFREFPVLDLVRLRTGSGLAPRIDPAVDLAPDLRTLRRAFAMTLLTNPDGAVWDAARTRTYLADFLNVDHRLLDPAYGFQPRKAQEALEAGVVDAARVLWREGCNAGLDILELFKAVQDLYQRQPVME